MVVLFKGTNKSKNYAPQAVALCAGISATRFYKKNLIIQLTTKYPIENYLIGKKIREQSIANNGYLFEDTGLDSLIRRVGVASFRQEHFSNAVTPIVNSENLLDVLDISKKTEEDLIRELTQTPTIIGTIIKAATKIYDNIFVLANDKNNELIDSIIPYFDKTVTCISQGIKEKITAKSTDDHVFLVTSFDYKSSYSTKLMEKTYGKKAFIMPYNVDFKDYYTGNNMLQYILQNVNPEDGDYSFHLIDEMSKLVRYLTENEEVENDDYIFSKRLFERRFAPYDEIRGDELHITDDSKHAGKIRNTKYIEKPKKKKTFSKKSKEIYKNNDYLLENENDYFELDNDDYSDIDNEINNEFIEENDISEEDLEIVNNEIYEEPKKKIEFIDINSLNNNDYIDDNVENFDDEFNKEITDCIYESVNVNKKPKKRIFKKINSSNDKSLKKKNKYNSLNNEIDIDYLDEDYNYEKPDDLELENDSDFETVNL